MFLLPKLNVNINKVTGSYHITNNLEPYILSHKTRSWLLSVLLSIIN